MLEMRNVSLRLGEKQILSGCDLRLSDGERVALMGPSGCGKTRIFSEVHDCLLFETSIFNAIKHSA